MGAIEDVYEDLEADVSLEEFREAVEAKVSQMGGLADEETAAMLVAHEHEDGGGGGEVDNVADVEAGMEEVKFVAKVLSVGEVRTFERDGDDDDGHVVNVELADESGTIRGAFWDEQAAKASEELGPGDVLRVKGRPKEGYNGVELNVDRAEADPDVDVDVSIQDSYAVEDLSLGLSDVNLKGTVLDTDSVRTFDRDDGSEGKVSNLALGDETGRVRVTMWDGMADRATELSPGTSVEVVDGYVRERDGDLELHVGERGAVEALDEQIEYTPTGTPIADVEIGDTVDLSGIIRDTDPKRTFDRDDGSEGQVKNVRVQDKQGDDIRVALWGDKADTDLQPGDEVAFTDVEIQDGWQDDLEASANWKSTVVVTESDPVGAGGDSGTDEDAGLDAFAGEDAGADAAGEAAASTDADDDSTGAATGDAGGGAAAVERQRSEGESVTFTGTVVQAGSPVVLDDGEETMSVETDADLHLGQQVRAEGVLLESGRLDAIDVSPTQ
jgi:ssDNA-binding replication factor A large subunit